MAAGLRRPGRATVRRCRGRPAPEAGDSAPMTTRGTEVGTGQRDQAHLRADDRGAVTVEAALGLCSLMLVLALALAAVAATTAAVRCLDASRELARLAARGEPDRGRSVAAALAPAGAVLELTRAGDTVTAEVSDALIPPLPLRVSGRSVAAVEPGVGPP